MDSEVVKRMKEVEKATAALDISVRGEAFAMMHDYIINGDATDPSRSEMAGQKRSGSTRNKGDVKVVAPASFDAFIMKFESDVPATNAMALAAYLYGQYGIEPLSVDEVEELAEKAGVTIPTRTDNTIRQKMWKKKKAFRMMSTGRFRPTIAGEAFFREAFGVKKGTKKRPKADR
jgi:hypothetical protein